jgi:GntR family transcriptional regulator
MAQFFIDKNNKIPIYLQLKDQIKYFISTGSLTAEEKLPPVKVLAKTLGINFLTVRKAYKELEENGLVNVRHGEGSFISLSNSSQKTNSAQSDRQNQFAGATKQLVEQYAQKGLEFAELKRISEEVFAEIESSKSVPIIIFAECNQFQIKQISKILQEELKLNVKPMLVEDLAQQIPLLMDRGRKINIVTTGFHINEVRDAVGELTINIDVLITNLNPKTRRQLESYGEKASYSFICRDRESTILYKDLLKAELGYRQIHLTSCILTETEKVKNILNSTDIVLVSPPVFEEVRKLAPPEKAVYNLFERVDPMSLKVIKDRILGNRHI